MRVLFLPDHTAGNPYQELLAGGLKEEGIDVTLASGYPLSTLRTLISSRPDVIHVHWIAPFLVTESLLASALKSAVFLQATLVAKLLGIRVVWTVHNLLDHERQHPRLELAVRRLYAQLSDGIIVHCAAARESVMCQYRIGSDRRPFVIPHGHYNGCYENTVSQAQAREELGLEPDATTFLYLGQIRPYKQVPHLVDAFSAVFETDARLVIAGKPTDESESRRIRSRIQGDPRITTEFGYVPAEDLQLYLNAADAVVLPYRDLLTSGSAILGMTFGNPIVGPHVGCLPELLEGQQELLYNPETDSLAAALRRAADADLDEIGDQNRQRVMEYDWNAVCSATRRVYERV